MDSQLFFLHQHALGAYIDALYTFQEEKRTTGSVTRHTASMLEYAAQELARIEALFLSPEVESNIAQSLTLAEQTAPNIKFPRKFKVIKGGKQ